MKEHFIDSWANFKDPLTVANCLDKYEAIKYSPKKMWNSKHPFEKKYEKTGNADKSCSDTKYPEI